MSDRAKPKEIITICCFYNTNDISENPVAIIKSSFYHFSKTIIAKEENQLT